MATRLRKEQIRIEDFIQALSNVDWSNDQLTVSAAAIEEKIRSFNIKYGTTDFWNHSSYTPSPGEIIIYTNYETETVEGVSKSVPNLKVGTGNAFVVDLPFVGSHETQILLNHISDSSVHFSVDQKHEWLHKHSVEQYDADNEKLIFETIKF